MFVSIVLYCIVALCPYYLSVLLVCTCSDWWIAIRHKLASRGCVGGAPSPPACGYRDVCVASDALP